MEGWKAKSLSESRKAQRTQKTRKGYLVRRDWVSLSVCCPNQDYQERQERQDKRGFFSLYRILLDCGLLLRVSEHASGVMIALTSQERSLLQRSKMSIEND